MAQILLIEPDRRLAETYAQALQTDGHRVRSAAGAQAAISAADAATPDLIILELQLVEHSGIEFLYELRSYTDWQHIPVIVHTQVPPGEFDGSRGLLEDELGVRSYLYKPRTSLRRLLAETRQLTAVTT